MARYLDSYPVLATLVAPVPMHPRRLRQRGYNQSALLAREVGKVRSLPVVQDLLTRIQNMASQVSLANREDRARNAQGSFACQGSVSGESVLLVDDVSTMGSTLGACAQILKERGASSVWGLVLAGEA
jgi:ComF family protein